MNQPHQNPEQGASDAAPRNRRRVVQGIVSTDAMAKSIGVRVERMFKHPKYKKYIRRHSKVYAHDETNEARVGDRVEIMECRPLSKTKRYRLVRIVERPALSASTYDSKHQAGSATASVSASASASAAGGVA
jgi:small subunit ribosomal protein S17